MVGITFIHPSGRSEKIDVADGMSLMHGATAAGVDGIVGECGGSAMCATCHVYLDEGQVGRVPGVNEVEHEMLDSTAAERRPTSRLSCQIIVTTDMEGLVLHLPDTQL